MREALGRKADGETFAWLMDAFYSMETELIRAVCEDVLNFRTLCKVHHTSEQLNGMGQNAFVP